MGRFITRDPVFSNNLYAYTDNNPVMRIDPNGRAWDIFDVGFAAGSWYDFAKDPGWGNFGWAAYDTVALLPIIPSSGYVRAPAKIAKAVSKGIGKVDINVKPQVSHSKLQNIINDLYKGQGSANTIGNGTTMDAVRNEILTGNPTNGKFHTSKLNDYVNVDRLYLTGQIF